jgi:hypothetical protein
MRTTGNIRPATFASPGVWPRNEFLLGRNEPRRSWNVVLASPKRTRTGGRKGSKAEETGLLECLASQFHALRANGNSCLLALVELVVLGMAALCTACATDRTRSDVHVPRPCDENIAHISWSPNGVKLFFSTRYRTHLPYTRRALKNTSNILPLEGWFGQRMAGTGKPTCYWSRAIRLKTPSVPGLAAATRQSQMESRPI